ncbi:DUF4255 domain-containing protein [Phormidium sp. CCY1219]|nr:DUF4255 domain-containing protein [Phormidium sp. CCY1219]
MIPAVAQTLAEILAGGTSLIAMDAIDFDRPSAEGRGPRLNLYCYDVRENAELQQSQSQTDGAIVIWYDLSFVLTAWDYTALGEQRLLSEALTLLLPHPFLPEAQLDPALRRKGALPMKISVVDLSDKAALWRALGVPLRPGLYVTVSVPIAVEKQAAIGNSTSFTSTP